MVARKTTFRLSAWRSFFAPTAVLFLTAMPAIAGHSCWYCYKMPKPSGPINNCYGYFPTAWRAWPAECQTPPAQIPIISTSPSPEKLPVPDATLPKTEAAIPAKPTIPETGAPKTATPANPAARRVPLNNRRLP